MIALDPACLKVEVELTATTVLEEVRSVPSGTSSSWRRVNITGRSMKFANSGTLPFHGQFVRMSIACLGIDLICLRIRAENFEMKKLTSNGISSRRSLEEMPGSNQPVGQRQSDHAQPSIVAVGESQQDRT
jgi:hypothetical protein